MSERFFRRSFRLTSAFSFAVVLYYWLLKLFKGGETVFVFTVIIKWKLVFNMNKMLDNLKYEL